MAARRHRAVVAISAGELDAGAREKIRAAHGGLVTLVVQALSTLGHTQPRMAAMLLQGIVDAAVRRLEFGAAAEDPETITDAAVDGDALGLALARIVGIADRLLDESKDWLWIGGRMPDQAGRVTRNPKLLPRYLDRLPELAPPPADTAEASEPAEAAP